MKNLINGFADQLKEAVAIGSRAKIAQPEQTIQNVVIAGLGGSGIGGDLVKSFTRNSLLVPLISTKNYEIPGFVNKNTLFIACSYSGNTEETLAALEKAKQNEATIVCISSGGKMIETAQSEGLDFIKIPGGTDCPRACIGYSFTCLLAVLKKFDLINTDFAAEILAGADRITRESDEIIQHAKEIARNLHDRLPVIYSDDLLEPLALRFQQQINENAKQLAHINVFPEMNHNELVGWEYPHKITGNAVILLIKTPFDHPRVSQRMAVCRPVFEKKSGKVIEINSSGNSFVELSIYLIHLFDWASYYLAELNGTDPFPVNIITYLKSELAKH